jgi:hypothetical protein
MTTNGRLSPILLLLLWLNPICATASDASPCRSAAYRALNFTIGTWKVTDPDGGSRGVATVAYNLAGCAVVESWSAPDGHSGTNVDAYSSDDNRWHRLFVDNKGHVHTFVGTTTRMRIRYEGSSKGPHGEDVLNRLSITAQNPNEMIQVWQQSHDRGRTWNGVFFDHYSRM